MARTALTPVQAKQLAPGLTLPIAAGSLDVGLVAGDNVNGNNFIPSGRDLLVVSGTGTFTIKSVPDSLGRSGDVGPYTLGANPAHFFIDDMQGLKQADGMIWIDCSAATVKFAVIQCF